jgi:predicted ribosome quality control (RQC) complex YloA/Tae2 family protein
MITNYIIDNNTNIEYICNIGRSAQENWDLFDESNENDLWFHLEDSSSPYVILKTNNTKKNKISKNVIKTCAIYCKQYSKLKSSNNVSIIYTEIKNIKKTNIVGSVITTNVKKIII